MDADNARRFISDNHRGVLITYRKDGSVQSSPVTPGVDERGRVSISSRETAYKVRNLQRDPRATLCVFTDNFYGSWVQVEGEVEIVPLPEAMELLVDYYRRISGEHPDWDDYRAAMEKDRRVIIRFEIERAGPDRAG